MEAFEKFNFVIFPIYLLSAQKNVEVTLKLINGKLAKKRVLAEIDPSSLRFISSNYIYDQIDL